MANKPEDDQYTDEFLDDSYETEENNPDNGENSDEWDDGDYSDDPDSNQDNGGLDNKNTEKKKKSSLSTIIIIAVAVIGCLGFLVLKFGGDSSPTPTEQPVEQAEVTNSPSPENPTGVENAVATPVTTPTTPENVVDATPDTQGFMMAPEKVENIVIKKPEPPPVEKPAAEAPIATEPPPIGFPDDNMAAAPGNVPDNKTNDLQAAPDLTAGNAPPAEFPTVANILKPQPDVKEALSDTPPVPESPADLGGPALDSPAPSPVSDTTAVGNAAQNPIANMDDLKKSPEYVELTENLNTANKKIAQLEQKLADQAKSTTEADDNSDEIAALQEKIAELQEKLEAKEAASARPITPSTRTVTKRVVTENRSISQPAKRVIWTLRSASPGKAIVYNSAANETKTVRIGDRIATIGTITNIEKVGGNWVVQGTTGKISR